MYKICSPNTIVVHPPYPLLDNFNSVFGLFHVDILINLKRQRNKWKLSHWTFLLFISPSKQIQNLHINISPARFYKTIIYIFSCWQQPCFFFKDILHAKHVHYWFCLGDKSTLSVNSPFNLMTTNMAGGCCQFLVGTIYQPLRSGRIWHKVNF